MEYPVNEIYVSIQGEGVHTGVPMVIVRLQGCSLRCEWCDTKYTWSMADKFRVDSIDEVLTKGQSSPYWTYMTAEQIAQYVARLAPGLDWVMLTGGEPLMYNLNDLLLELHHTGYKVAVETNGTQPLTKDAMFDVVYPEHICVSPKLGVPGGEHISPEVAQHADEIKFVIVDQESIGQAHAALQMMPYLQGYTQVLLQPVMGVGDFSQVLQLCMQEVVTRGWRLSVQVHKLLNVP